MTRSQRGMRGPDDNVGPRIQRDSGSTHNPCDVPRMQRQLPPWKVVLRHDDDNPTDYIAQTLVALTPLNDREAAQRTNEAQQDGLSVVLTTHRERAELYGLQLGKRNLYVTIEPA